MWTKVSRGTMPPDMEVVIVTAENGKDRYVILEARYNPRINSLIVSRFQKMAKTDMLFWKRDTIKELILGNFFAKKNIIIGKTFRIK